MQAVTLARVLSREQDETGYSLPAQEKLLKSYAEKQGLTVARSFAISESAGGKKQRIQFAEMIAYVKKNNIKRIIIEKVDRLTRNFKDAVMMDDWLEEDPDRQVHFVKDALVLHKNSRSQEKLNWGIRVVLAKNYIDNLSEEVKKGQAEKLAQGWQPSRPPLGYKTIGERGHKIHIPDEKKAPLMRKLFELYASGLYSVKTLTTTINDAGLTNEKGNELVRSRVHQLLKDPFYCGKTRWNGKSGDGQHEALISTEIFNKVQAVLTGKNTPKYGKHAYFFQKLLRCAQCGGMITWESHKRIIYGHCNHYRNCTHRKWHTQDDIEHQLIEEFEKLKLNTPRIAAWIRKAIQESHQDQIAYYHSAVNELNQKHEQIKKRLDHLYDDKMDGNITEDFYQTKFQQYCAERDTVLEALQKHANASVKYYEIGINIFDISQKAMEIYRKATNMDDRKQLISLVFDKLELSETALHITYTKAFTLLAKAVLLTNMTKFTESKVDKKEIFVKQDKVDTIGQLSYFIPLRPEVLRD